MFYLDVRLVISSHTISDGTNKDTPRDYLVAARLNLFALTLLVLTDALIVNLVAAGEFFRGNKIVGRPLRAIRAEVPSISA